MKPANVIVPILLFILLTPGLLVTLPSKNSSHLHQTLVHAVIFGAVYFGLRKVFPQYY